MKFGVIGGDMRAAHLCGLLALDGHEVSAFGMERAELSGGYTHADCIHSAVKGAGCVVLPLPLTGRKGYLNAPLSKLEMRTEAVLNALSPDQTICAGRVENEVLAEAKERGLRIIDFFEREELCVYNAVATAEGALSIIMQETPTTVWGMRILVVGYGRIGKVLAHRLKGMGAIVAVSARNHGDRAWIEALGYRALNTYALEGQLADFDVVVNTVPAPVLGERRLSELKPGALCVDLASKPGGMDFAAAGRIGVHAVWALSLPGEVAPVSAGRIIRDTIYNILGES